MAPGNRKKKEKKGKKDKRNKKLEANEKKLQTVKENLMPVPFYPPSKILDFDRHEMLLRSLGLWDFAHIEFDRGLRVDLIAQLIANYDSKSRDSWVNGFRIAVNRADLGRALKLPPSNKAKRSVVVDLDVDTLSGESISFLESFVHIWMLLHDDTWITPNEVLSWTMAIKYGHPEKVDWAGLFWFMVEKELTQGDQLVHCYYAAHLQQLIKSQRGQLLFSEEQVEFEVYVKEEDNGRDGGLIEACNARDGGSIEILVLDDSEDNARDGGSIEARELDGVLQGELNIELALGQDLGQKKEVKDVEMIDVEDEIDNENDNDNDEEEEDEGAERHKVEDGFDVMPSDDTIVGSGLTGKLFQSTQIAFTSQGQLHDQSSVELLASRYEMHTGSGSKREIEIEPDVANHSLIGIGSNKRLRVDGTGDEKPLDFGSSTEQMQQLLMKARMMYEAKKQNEEQLQNILEAKKQNEEQLQNILEAKKQNEEQLQNILNELHKRHSEIEHLCKFKCDERDEEIQKRDGEIGRLERELQKRDRENCRLERELFTMGEILAGYWKALKETQKRV